MINKETIKTLTEEWLHDNDYFLVDINFASDDRIVIEIDHADGVWIAGLGQPFKVAQQYINHIGDTVEVLDQEGKKVLGTLKSVDGRDFVVTIQEKQKQEGKKRPVIVDVDKVYSMDNIKYAKYILAFK